MSDFQFAEFKRIVESCVGTDSDSTFDESMIDTAFDELGMDSLAVYEISTRLQDELKIAISDDEVDRFKTPREVLDLINQRLAEAAGSR